MVCNRKCISNGVWGSMVKGIGTLFKITSDLNEVARAAISNGLIISVPIKKKDLLPQMKRNLYFTSILSGRTFNEIENYWNIRLRQRQRAGIPLYPLDIQRNSSKVPPQLTPLMGLGNDALFDELPQEAQKLGELFIE
ncbi:hypothetical protein IEQ34_002363 [Dendrobium chrysotoxum]|uniref:Uncharacterized protein n=1 Tax=Dendrobium chrysotoxum TaxID=161865 RepID=A0AAV7HKH1_DENCH|nr:hypothetical protein IEQ34_002363 [Dendrobium chrysotoxum]